MIRWIVILRTLTVIGISFALSLFVGGSASTWEDTFFDTLIEVKEPIPVASELLVLYPGTATAGETPREPDPVELIWTLAELGAERLLIPPTWPPVDRTAFDLSQPGSELSSRLDREFARIDENIAELFEAIRIGAIEPGEAQRFVEQLRQLVADSNARIRGGLERDSRTVAPSVEDLIHTFGSDRIGRKLSDFGVSLPSYPSGVAIPVPPRPDAGGADFRRLPYSVLRRYVSESNRLAVRLSALEEAGYFDEVDPRNRPSIMQDYIRSLRRELYEHPTEHRAAAWRGAVDQYFQVVAGLISEAAEARLVERLGMLEDTGNLDEESASQIRDMKQELASIFVALRVEYTEVTELRNELTEAIGESFVILEDPAAERAVVANSALVEEHVYAPDGWNRTLLLTVAGVMVGILLVPFRAGTSVILAPIGLLLGTVFFITLFVVADIWVAPVAIAAVLVGAIFASAGIAVLADTAVEHTLTGGAGCRLPRKRLRGAVFRGGLPPQVLGRRRAAVVVVTAEVKSGTRVAELNRFQRAVSRKIRNLGGLVLGEEGLTVFAVFDAEHSTDEARLARTACAAAKALVSPTFSAGISAGGPVRCGVEIGDVIFYVSPIAGYRATGRTITYARRFCELAHKHRSRALFGLSFVTAYYDEDGQGESPFHEKGKLVISSGGERYAFYRLTEIDPA